MKIKPPSSLPCEVNGCKRKAKFRAKRAGVYRDRDFCPEHAAEKFGKYDVELETLR